MAQSPAHRFGQIIGEVLEAAVRPVFERIAAELHLFLDGKGERPARGVKRKVTWTDGRGNAHDLDYVFEAGGAVDRVGSPRAFIETAWRRYTKHSRNKAQEIQGAILPLAERYSDSHPFLGVVLGGVFTKGSLDQLRSHGFHVLYFPYPSIIRAFAVAGIDALYDEDTPDAVLKRRVKQFAESSAADKQRIAAALRKLRPRDLKEFTSALRVVLLRKINLVYILPLHGVPTNLASVDEAIAFIDAFDEAVSRGGFARYELGVRYTNGDEVRGQFQDKATAIAFLKSMQ